MTFRDFWIENKEGVKFNEVSVGLESSSFRSEEIRCVLNIALMKN